MRLGLDIDGVLADFQGGWVRAYNEWHGARIEVSEATQWGSFLELTHFHEEDDFWAWTDRVPGFWRDLHVIDGAMGGIDALLKAGNSIELITNRHANTMTQTQEWVAAHWPVGARMPIIHHTKDKSLVSCQLYLDDSPPVILDLTLKGLPVVRFEQPWNKSAKPNAGSVKDWPAAVALIDDMAKALV